jgi:hypothetical protein
MGIGFERVNWLEGLFLRTVGDTRLLETQEVELPEGPEDASDLPHFVHGTRGHDEVHATAVP